MVSDLLEKVCKLELSVNHESIDIETSIQTMLADKN
jgi:hypothetical protein